MNKQDAKLIAEAISYAVGRVYYYESVGVYPDSIVDHVKNDVTVFLESQAKEPVVADPQAQVSVKVRQTVKEQVAKDLADGKIVLPPVIPDVDE